MTGTGRQTIRLDKWLWYARFFKTRTLAAQVVAGGHVRVNGARVSRPARTVGAGDVLTFAQAGRIRVIRLAATGSRRGPAAEAEALYLDLDPPGRAQGPAAPQTPGGARPTKKARRALDRSRELRLE